MNASEGRVFSIAAENRPVPGCTVSQLAEEKNGYYILHFSLAEGTGISPETYRYPKFWLTLDGAMEAVISGRANVSVKSGDLYVTPRGLPVGVRTSQDCVYTEITLKEGSSMGVSQKKRRKNKA